MGSLLGVIAIPVMFIAGGVALNALKTGEARMAGICGIIFAVSVIVFLSSPKANGTFDRNCIEYSRFADDC